MEPLEITLDVCRICLEHKENINWNDKIKEFCEISYKDCYYRYIQLDKPDLDYFPTNLCSRCANKLRDTHMFFEMALESFKILQTTFKVKEFEVENTHSKICNSSQETLCELSLINDKTHLDIDEVMCFSPVYESTLKENDFNEIGTEENSKSSFGILLEQQPLDRFNVKLLKSVVDKEWSNERRNLETFETTLELNLQLEVNGSNLLKAPVKKTKNKPNAYKSSYKAPMKSIAREKVQPNAMIQNTRNNTHQFVSTNILQYPKFAEPSYVQKKVRKQSKIKSPKKTENRSDPSDYTDSLNENCIECDTYSLASLTQKHINPKELQKASVSDISIKKYEKSMLEKIFGKNIDINALMGRKPQKPRELICQYCSVKVKGSCHLKTHEATHLENRERNIICSKCGMKFYTKESLNAHRKIHDENRQRNYKCEFCDKAFFHRGALNVHRRIHLGLMVKCQLCPKEFYRQIDLDKHLPTHSATAIQSNVMSAKQKKYTVQCQYCNVSVLTTKWRAHKAAHLNEPQVKCKICDKDFFSRHSCYRHIKKTHRKTRSEIEENIHSYVDWSRRMSHLMMVQQESLKPLTE